MGDENTNSHQGRIGVVSGRFPASTFASNINHKAYCNLHGYTYINCNWPTGAKNPYMNKMRFIQAYYHLFEFIFWIDDDAFFMNMEKRLEDIMPTDESFLSICSSPDYKNIHTFISSGQFMLRCDDIGRDFIDQVERTNLEVVRQWWKKELGFFTNGDQDAMVHLMLSQECFSKFDRHSYTLFNSRFDDYLQNKNIFILHFTGTVQKKFLAYKEVQKRTGLGPALILQCYKNKLEFEDEKTKFRKIVSWIKRTISSR